jgi:3-oxoacyl-[acyl-carrier-protein] synthase-3
MTNIKHSGDEVVRLRGIVESCLRSVLPEDAEFPGDEADWIASGLLDSMAHVEVLVCIERAAGVADMTALAGGTPPTTISSAIETLRKAASESPRGEARLASSEGISSQGSAGISGWGYALGSQHIPVVQVEGEFSLPAGTLSKRAGIKGVRRAGAEDDEISLARAASEDALRIAEVSVQNLDWIIATSETLQGFPSLAASLHSALLAPGTCNVLDVGGACTALLNGLVVADALFADSRVRSILVASADVHSRILVPGRVSGGFGGLFGDGASAFVLRRTPLTGGQMPYSMRVHLGSCAGTFSSALRVRPGAAGSIVLNFDGETLAHAALDRMERIISDLETTSGLSRQSASAFAIHQPNPRLVEVFLRRKRLPPDKLPLVAKSAGNLGSSTCGVALGMALEKHGNKPRSERGPIFLAAVGPGMLWSGAVLD